MKLLERILFWVLSLLCVALGVLLLILVLFPSLTWLQLPAVRITVGVLALLSILCTVALHLMRASGKKEEAALASEGENGSAFVSMKVLGDMTKRIAQDQEGVRACKSKVMNNGAGVDVELEMALDPGVAVAPMAASLQEQLKNRVFEMTGVHVGKVGILVEAASEAKAPKQPAVEQLPPGQTK